MFSAHSLLTDRLKDFQGLAQRNGTLGEDSGDGTPLANSTTQSTSISTKLLGKATTQLESEKSSIPAKSAFMKEFFEKVNEINSLISKGKSNVKQMGIVLEKALQATTQEKQREVSDELQNLVDSTNLEVKTVKDRLEDLRKETAAAEAQNSDSGHGKAREIRENMQNQLTKKHRQLILDFQQAQQGFKDALQAQQVREMRLLRPDLSEPEVRKRIDEGETSSVLVAQQIAGTHALLLDEINRIKEKHQDILRLERSMADLHQMFQEVAVLVDQQGEMLDAIEVHVHTAKNYTKKAEEQLQKARKAQHKASRWMCCLAGIMLIILLAILSSVILAQ